MKAIIAVPQTNECEGCIFQDYDASCGFDMNLRNLPRFLWCGVDKTIYKIIEIEDKEK